MSNSHFFSNTRDIQERFGTNQIVSQSKTSYNINCYMIYIYIIVSTIMLGNCRFYLTLKDSLDHIPNMSIDLQTGLLVLMIVVLVIFVVLVRRGVIHPRERVSKMRRAVSQRVRQSRFSQVVYNSHSGIKRPQKKMTAHSSSVCTFLLNTLLYLYITSK